MFNLFERGLFFFVAACQDGMGEIVPDRLASLSSKLEKKFFSWYNTSLYATVAQSVEQLIRNQWVSGSIPLGGFFLFFKGIPYLGDNGVGDHSSSRG